MRVHASMRAGWMVGMLILTSGAQAEPDAPAAQLPGVLVTALERLRRRAPLL